MCFDTWFFCVSFGTLCHKVHANGAASWTSGTVHKSCDCCHLSHKRHNAHINILKQSNLQASRRVNFKQKFTFFSNKKWNLQHNVAKSCNKMVEGTKWVHFHLLLRNKCVISLHRWDSHDSLVSAMQNWKCFFNRNWFPDMVVSQTIHDKMTRVELEICVFWMQCAKTWGSFLWTYVVHWWYLSIFVIVQFFYQFAPQSHTVHYECISNSNSGWKKQKCHSNGASGFTQLWIFATQCTFNALRQMYQNL